MKKFLIVFLLALVAFGCSAETITIAGSTSVAPLVEEIATEYDAKYQNKKIVVNATGSSAGVKAVLDGTAQIGMVSRELTSEEKAKDITAITIANDGIAVVVHPSNQVKNLTLEQVAQIFTGKITNWQEVGGKDSKIIVVIRDAASGTRGAFEELVHKGKRAVETALVSPTTGTVRTTIATTKTAIGYISLGALDKSVKAVTISGVEANEQNVLAGTYKISRPLALITKGKTKSSLQQFIDFCLGDIGQEIAAMEFIPVKQGD